MADSGGQISGVPDQVLDASIPVKKRRNKPADRIKSRLSKSSKLRAGTPEPEQRTFTDDSEKDISDGEYLPKSGLPEAGGEGLGRQNSGIRRMINRGKHDTARSRSLERPTATKETESEDDFEVIRRMHKNKELEEERKEAEKLIQDTKPKVEELREFVPKEMPPLIVAPKDLKKRRRHKSLPLPESQSEEEKPKTPLVKARERVVRRKPSTSEEEDLSSSRRGSAHSKAEDDGTELRVRKIGAKRIIKTIRRERDTSESEGVGEDEKPEDDRTVDDKVVEKKEESKPVEKKPWFFTRWFSKSKEIKSEVEDKDKDKEEGNAEVKEKEEQKIEKKERESIMKEKQLEDKREKEESSKEKVKRGWLIAEIFYEWRDHVNEHKVYYHKFMRLKNRCATDLLILLLFCGFGGLVFRFTEGAFESFYKCGVKRVKRDFIDTLWKYSQYMLEEDWKSQARRKLMEFEDQLHSAHEAGMTTYSGQKSWSFLNAVVYCLTVVTTIGYGHISPSTTTGRAITIIYAIFGIPMFLILLADFGKLFTRGIKFLWAFVRRLYYTGSCRRVRKTAPVQEMMKGVQIMYDFAKARRQTMTGYPGQQQEHQNHLRPPDPNMQGIPETPGTPNWSAFEIDDEFNLPISVAISILLIYIFLGATLYWMWEDWSFFESFYFVFISMSTIGFGDFVPQHPMYMMLSIVYLMFGLALTSMCINVVQEKLSDTFRQASAKLGTTIGLTVVEDPAICPPDAVIMEENNQQMS